MSLEDDLLKQRLARIREIEALGYRPYGRRFDFTHTIPEILAAYGAKTAEELPPEVRVRVAGRLMTLRHMGKAGFAHLQQNGERLQIYVKKDAVGERDYQLFKLLDIGDIIGVDGYLFRTRTGELSIHVEKLEFLSKTLLSMPEKWHGLEDVETRYRQRYLDLDRQSRRAQSLRHPRPHHLLPAPPVGGARLHRSGNAHDAAALRRRRGAALRHPSQHARYRSLPAHRARSCT